MNHQMDTASDCRKHEKEPFIAIGLTRYFYVSEEGLEELRTLQDGLRKQLALVNAADADIERRQAIKAAATAGLTPTQPFNDMEIAV